MVPITTRGSEFNFKYNFKSLNWNRAWVSEMSSCKIIFQICILVNHYICILGNQYMYTRVFITLYSCQIVSLGKTEHKFSLTGFILRFLIDLIQITLWIPTRIFQVNHKLTLLTSHNIYTIKVSRDDNYWYVVWICILLLDFSAILALLLLPETANFSLPNNVIDAVKASKDQERNTVIKKLILQTIKSV